MVFAIFAGGVDDLTVGAEDPDVAVHDGAAGVGRVFFDESLTSAAKLVAPFAVSDLLAAEVLLIGVDGGPEFGKELLVDFHFVPEGDGVFVGASWFGCHDGLHRLAPLLLNECLHFLAPQTLDPRHQLLLDLPVDFVVPPVRLLTHLGIAARCRLFRLQIAVSLGGPAE